MNKIRLEIISPERTLADLEVDMVIIPGGEGDYGVLYGHENYITTVRPGVVEIYQGNSITERFVVALGSAEVTGKLCTILVDEATKVGEVVFEEVEKRLEDSKRYYDKESSDTIKANIINEIKYLEEIMRFKN